MRLAPENPQTQFREHLKSYPRSTAENWQCGFHFQLHWDKKHKPHANSSIGWTKFSENDILALTTRIPLWNPKEKAHNIDCTFMKSVTHPIHISALIIAPLPDPKISRVVLGHQRIAYAWFKVTNHVRSFVTTLRSDIIRGTKEGIIDFSTPLPCHKWD